MSAIHRGKLGAVNGKRPPRHDPRTLRASTFYRARRAPPPACVVWADGGVWPMLANDELGCCTVATCGHQSLAWAEATGTAGARAHITEADVRKAYGEITGYPEAGDVGAVMLDVFKHWRNKGIGPSKIDGFAFVDPNDVTDLRHAIHVFGGCAVGFNVPKRATETRRWTRELAAESGPRFGHATDCVGYDSEGLSLVSWGGPVLASWEFVAACADEAWAIVSHEWLAPDGRSPNGIDMGALVEAIARVSGTPKANAGDDHHPWFEL